MMLDINLKMNLPIYVLMQGVLAMANNGPATATSYFLHTSFIDGKHTIWFGR
jgi:cyclophilin family peptidyl-prolyl cis-trans isomerase